MIYNNNTVLIEDFSDNLHLFNLDERTLKSYSFNKNKKGQEKKISSNVLGEYDISIDNKNDIYIIYQDKNYHLILLINTGKSIKEIKLTEEPMPEIFNLNLEIIDQFPHIFYNVLLEEKKYRIVHHYYNGQTWTTNLVEDIKINQVLNPIKIIPHGEEIKLIYYNMEKKEEIYCKNFNFNKGQWEKAIRLTESLVEKLYLDALIINGKLHLTYCEYDENLVVKYERYELKALQREIELEISNKENISWPTLIYYENTLWLVWIEYENVLSRFSLDMGDNWASIYLWKDIKGKDIVRYKYINRRNKNILNHSFGIYGEDIKFIGFGSLDNAVEIPLKKNYMNLSF